jgi:hypothetical protein
MTYLDKLGDWIEKAIPIGKKYKTFHSDWVPGRVVRYIGGNEKR